MLPKLGGHSCFTNRTSLCLLERNTEHQAINLYGASSEITFARDVGSGAQDKDWHAHWRDSGGADASFRDCLHFDDACPKLLDWEQQLQVKEMHHRLQIEVNRDLSELAVFGVLASAFQECSRSALTDRRR